MSGTSFFGAHLLVLGTWFVAALALAGVGRLTLGWFGRHVEGWRDLSTCFWLGVATVIGATQLWHFLGPVNGAVTAALLLVGAAGLWGSRAELVSLVRRSRMPTWPVALGTALLVLWIANRAIGPSRLYDTGMYHQPLVNWINAYPVVPGLGNLHGRLAFNPSSLLFAALFDVGPLDKLALHLTNGLLYSVLIVEGIASWAATRQLSSPRAFHLFSIAILPDIIHGAVRFDVRSLSSDASVAAMLFAGIRLLFDALAHRVPERGRRTSQAAIVTLLLVAAVTIKLSSAALVAGSVLVAFSLWWGADAHNERVSARHVARYLAPAAVLGTAWLARNVVLSGFPLYPAAVFPFDVDWRMLDEHVAGERAWIEASARGLNTNLAYAGLSWIRPWVRRVLEPGELIAEFTVPLLVIGLVALFLFFARRKLVPSRWSPGWWWIGVPFVPSVAYWAIAAPHPRLLHAVLWSGAAILVSFAAVVWPGRRRSPAELLGAGAGSLAIILLLMQGATAAIGSESPATQLAKAWFTLPSEPVLASLPPRGFTAYETNRGLQLVVPDGDNRCYNGPLLCTPHPSPHLAARDPANIARGFRIVGDQWEPARWPNPWSRFLPYWRCTRQGTGPRAERERACLRRVTDPAAGAAD